MTATTVRRPLPPLDGATEWLNSPPLRPDDLRGHPVLVNIWTLTCINWLRTLPYVRAWSSAYRGDGLVVVGVHTPEFAFEQDVATVRQSIEARDIDYPVAIDNAYSIWTALDNHYWPAFYFVDGDGTIRDTHFGEGRYEESERQLQALLGISRDLVTVDPVGVEAAADWDGARTPETYLGYGQAIGFVSMHESVFDEPRTYELPDELHVNQWGLDGRWVVAGEKIIPVEPGGTIAIRFEARDVHLILAPGASGPIGFRVRLDGKPPGPAHGIDVDENGDGMLREGRLYQLVRVPDRVRERTLEITFLDPGAEAYAFTFG